MKITLSALAAVAVFAVACDNNATSPMANESAMLAFNQAATMDDASGVPRGGTVVDRELPAGIALTDAQKTAIKALHDAFAAAHATQFAQLKAIHDDARAAMKAGKPRADVQAILEKGRPIMESMKPDFEAMRAKVDALLTADQKAWFAAHHQPDRGPGGGPIGGARMGPGGPGHP